MKTHFGKEIQTFKKLGAFNRPDTCNLPSCVGGKRVGDTPIIRSDGPPIGSDPPKPKVSFFLSPEGVGWWAEESDT